MTRAAFLAALCLFPAARAVASGLVAASPGASPEARALDPLASPGSYSLAPSGPASILDQPLVAGGVASTSFGSNGMRASSIELDSGLIGGHTRAFVAVGAGQGPHWHDMPAIRGQSFAAGITTQLPHNTTITIMGGLERDRFTRPY
ncbi:hypothetical protein NFI95_15105 [Acetobacteraceae bacterium KSS8]|uniref:Uncharacterized protein n=1 Tax=Endosaccharibacter trunci TaxID=2812733 RepID=A0ABT1WA66_9PROT|nr:hypothetical protein [Acetobacteraceae bacterium KSS8]